MRKKRYDVVVIGSGLGGLTAAYILAKNGYNVVVFEKNAQIGGCMQTFRRRGAKFETGLHNIGSLRSGEKLHQLFKYLGLGNIPLAPLNKKGFNVISIGDEDFSLSQGTEQFIKTLADRFPEERKGLELYIHEIHHIAETLPYFSLKNIEFPQQLNPLYTNMSIEDFVGSYIKNETLKKVLCGYAHMYGGQRDVTPAFIHALFSDYYIRSSYKICGSSDKVARSLANSIRELGGEIYPATEVAKINCDENHAVNVQLPSGETIEAEYFICDTAPDIMLNLVKSNLIPQSYRDKVKNMSYTPSIFTVYVQFKKNTIPYCNHNFIRFEGDDVWDSNDYTDDTWPRSYIYLHNCPEDPSEYSTGAEIITYMRYEDVAHWSNYEVGQRGIKYEIFKQEKAQKLLNLWAQKFPEEMKNVESYYISTPLTYRDFTGSKYGSIFGILHDRNALEETSLSHRTDIQNLLLTGQNINLHGTLGVIISAFMACSEIIDKHTLIKQVEEA